MYTNILKCTALTGFTAFMLAANSLVAHAEPAIPNTDGVDGATYDAAVESYAESAMVANDLNDRDAIALEPTDLEATDLEATDLEATDLESAYQEPALVPSFDPTTTELNTLDTATSTHLEAIEPNPFDLALNEIDWIDEAYGDETDALAELDTVATPATVPSTIDGTSDFLSLNETFETSTLETQTTAPDDEIADATNIPEEIAATPESNLVSASVEASTDSEPIAPLADAVDSTSAMDLINQPTQAQTTDPAIDGLEVPATPGDPTEADTSIAQVIAPGQPTRSGPSYIGAGGNIGFGGSTGIGRGNFAVFSKLGLTNNFSLRPAVFVGDRTTFLIPVTLDFPTGALVDDAVPFSIAPYAGGGIGISTGDDSRVRPIITAGVDAPITNQFTATAGVTVGFFRNTEVGLMLGIGYNFGGF
ncbi:hypothetical protein [Egbenema bharatensis]|uniref:hypothetical protein n=1 Tax=Egbenema bharatensis TaxID=3463334 RepID=UPI003A838346